MNIKRRIKRGLPFARVLLPAAAALFPFGASAGALSFKGDVQPLLKDRCLKCHQPGGIGHEKSGFDVTSYEAVMKGTRNGPVVVAGDPLTSTLMMVLDKRVHKKIRMPLKGIPLDKEERGIIRKWIARGANND